MYIWLKFLFRSRLFFCLPAERALALQVGRLEMAAWADPMVARLAVGDMCAGDYCGLVIVCSWPMPEDVLARYEVFRAQVVQALPSAVFWY